ncbi:hypothetical protein BCR34DRAFT_587406 [Clohesyomyces aquaticus]|uniref:Mid2 domain-containing protein n=1 Tax=Clohesyomyces aquaticus TaxID=1231657 RepID=A0A1Y1ZPE0_9PLEO|nr:hypothetical protein BCR34DRAFT_587406 [Clohesyomyces aquaticus]
MACPALIPSIFAALCVLSFIFQFPRLAFGACYFPNGDTDSGHKSCSSGGVSVCCSEGHQCLSNGLCADPRYDNFQRVLRGGCTDSGWGSPCPSFCKTEWDHGDEAVYYCGNGKWCCDSHDCCEKSDSKMLELGTPSVTATADKDTNNNSNNNNAQPTSASPANVQQSSAPAQVNQPQSSQQPQQSQQQQAPSSAPPDSPKSSAKQDSAKAASTKPPSISSSTPNTHTSPSISATTSPGGKDSASKPSPNNTPATIVLISGYSIVLPTTSATSATSPAPGPAPLNPTIVGASIGVGGGVLTFLIVLFFCFYMPRRRQQKSRLEEERGLASRSITTGDSEVGLAGRGAGAGIGGGGMKRNRYGRGSGVLIELSADRVVELSAERDAKEMEGQGGRGGSEGGIWMEKGRREEWEGEQGRRRCRSI